MTIHIPETNLQRALAASRMRGVFMLLDGYRWIYAAAITSLILSTMAQTTIWLLLAWFADSLLASIGVAGAAPVAMSDLLSLAGVFLVLAAFQAGFSFNSGRMAARAAEGVALRLRVALFEHIQWMSFRALDKQQTGDLLQRSTSDVDAIRRFYSDQALEVGRILSLFIVNLAAIMVIHVPLALISVASVPVTVIISGLFFRRLEKVYRQYQEQEAVLSTTMQESLTAVRVVRAFARQDHETEKFEKENLQRFRLGRRMLTMYSLFWPCSDMTGGLQHIVGLVVGGLFVLEGEISVGAYVAYAGMLHQVIWPIRELGRLIIHFSTGIVSTRRVLEVVGEEREAQDEGLRPDRKLRGDLEFRNVAMHYDEGEAALKDISFCCGAGQTIALLGATGSGKTTLVNLLPRFYDYTGGSILLDGVELNKYSRGWLREQIGIIEQEPFLFSRSIRENITIGVSRDVTDEEVFAAARAAAVHDVILTFPRGYDTVVGERGVTLSGGQKQRLALARTLLRDPAILLLDDTTSSVDTETEAEIRAALNVLMEGRTTFIIAHRIQSLMRADLILVLGQGRIVQRGSHEQLLGQQGIYRQVYEVQERIDEVLEREVSHA
ncbi:MAG: ABC transporter ATP-binding protein [Anaerolineaceae bacterium]|nr:ABC transporter ATP-binding protein [Anaerolineaceae bacterium]